MSAIIEFYANRACDAESRTIEEILLFSDEDLECTHDYIQWLFPLPEASRFYARAPLLSKADIAVFRSDPTLQARVREALARMSDFYRASLKVRIPGDHNHLRITRIIHFLSLIGMTQEARVFLNLALEIAPNASSTAKNFWAAALVLK